MCFRFVILFLLFFTGPGYAESKVIVDFPGVELSMFLRWVSVRTGKRFVFEDNQRLLKQKKVYVVSSQPISQEAIFPLCLSVLEINGYTAVMDKDRLITIWKIIPTNKAASQPLPMVSKHELGQLQNRLLVSHLIILRHIAAQYIITAIGQAKLISQQNGGSIVAIQGANAVLITDFAGNIKRIAAMIELLDKPPAPTETVYIHLRHARASDIAGRIKQLISEQSRTRQSLRQFPSAQVTILPDDRINTVILIGDMKKIVKIKEMINVLDSEVKEQRLKHVLKTYYMEHTTTDKILSTLKELANSRILETDSKQNASSISIIANEHANALVIRAPVEVYPDIMRLIKQLDIRRPQVLLEVAVVEFSPSDLLSLGVELQTLDSVAKTNTSRMFSATQFGLSSLVDDAGQPLQGGALPGGKAPTIGSGMTTFITKGNGHSIPFLIRALQSTSMTEVHSIPRILTNDNQEAEIVLQDEVPVLQSTVDEGTTVTSFKEFATAGTTLRIKPHISRCNYLRLEITQTLESFVGVSNTPGTPPAKTSRSIKTTVTVPDGKTIILGGLVGRRETETVDKIPLLGDIPILGYLFQSRSKSVTQTSLYVFIIPKIIRHPDFKDLEEESKKHEKEMKAFIRKYKGGKEEGKE
jgi:general secretion pathway protein D